MIEKENPDKALTEFYNRQNLIDCLLCKKLITLDACEIIKNRKTFNEVMALKMFSSSHRGNNMVRPIKCSECRHGNGIEQSVTGHQIKQKRIERNLTQKQVAEELGIEKVSRQSIYKWETGQRKIHPEHWKKIRGWLK